MFLRLSGLNSSSHVALYENGLPYNSLIVNSMIRFLVFMSFSLEMWYIEESCDVYRGMNHLRALLRLVICLSLLLIHFTASELCYASIA
jgi:hypothetical protein